MSDDLAPKDYANGGVAPLAGVVCAEEAWLTQLDLARSGDAEALGEMINQVRDYLLLVANRKLDGRLKVKTAASDLVQQTLLEAGRDIQSFRGESEAELRTWLVKILKHNLTDTAREHRGTQRRDIGREKRLSGLGNALPSKHKTASSIIKRVERDEALDQAVLSLPERYRQAITLRHIEGLSWKAVSQRMEISAEAARKVWTRALEKLRDKLAQKDGAAEYGPRNASERTRATTSTRPR